MDLKNLAIIPARGGSKRIPKKNIKLFLGKPIIAYSIEVALESGLFDEVMVSTDDKEIANVAEEYGAKVPFFRSGENSTDYASLSDVIEEVKKFYLDINVIFNNICCILPTAPLITVDSLKKAFSILIENKNIDSVRPVVRYSYPVQRAVRIKDGKIEMVFPENRYTRSQDLEPTFHDSGQYYWMKFSSGLKGNNRYAFEIPELFAQDIDNESDWRLAELKYKNIH
jgi:pseudaminic acid cytidylyltransferase